MISPKVASSNASKRIMNSILEDLQSIHDNIKEASNNGYFSTIYNVKFKSNLDMIIANLTKEGYKVKHKWFLHSGYNTIEIKW